MSKKGTQKKNIQITPSFSGEDHRIPPLNKEQVLARLDWYGACVPVHQNNPQWLKWAFKRIDELNERLKDFQKHNRVAA